MTPIEWANKCIDDIVHKHPTRNEIAFVIHKAVTEERERCATYVEKNRVTGGSTPGPLWEIGWNTCCQETAKGLRGS